MEIKQNQNLDNPYYVVFEETEESSVIKSYRMVDLEEELSKIDRQFEVMNARKTFLLEKKGQVELEIDKINK